MNFKVFVQTVMGVNWQTIFVRLVPEKSPAQQHVEQWQALVSKTSGAPE